MLFCPAKHISSSISASTEHAFVCYQVPTPHPLQYPNPPSTDVTIAPKPSSFQSSGVVCGEKESVSPGLHSDFTSNLLSPEPTLTHSIRGLRIDVNGSYHGGLRITVSLHH